MATIVPFFNIISGAHEGSTGVNFSTRKLSNPISGLTVGMAVSLDMEIGDGGYAKCLGTNHSLTAEFVFETDEFQSSGTITTVWGYGEFETNVYHGDRPDIGDWLSIDGSTGKLKTDNVANSSGRKWVVTAASGKTIRFRTI